jgi:hypothetical protein
MPYSSCALSPGTGPSLKRSSSNWFELVRVVRASFDWWSITWLCGFTGRKTCVFHALPGHLYIGGGAENMNACGPLPVTFLVGEERNLT